MQTEEFGYELPDNVSAYQEIPSGAVFQVRGVEPDDRDEEWLEIVEVVDLDDDGNAEHITRLYEDHGTIPAQVYNRMISVYAELEK